MKNLDEIYRKVSAYYTQKIIQHGETSAGVDWNSKESQFLRFEKLCKILPPSKDEYFSILDYGCGYGALMEFLKDRFRNFRYIGFDISPVMIDKAKCLYGNLPNVSFYNQEINKQSDYVIASGIFNVKLDIPIQEWEAYIFVTLDKMNALSKRGFAFNMLTSYSDQEYMKDYLYYANPCYFFDYCKKHFSKNVALLHDYGLYEFTIHVKKQI